MISSLRPYPSYRDSGVPWLGQIPDHWGVRRLKALCTRSALYGANVSATSYTTTGVRFLRTTDITEDGQLRPEGVFLPEELVSEYVLADGDLLISRSGTIGRSFLYSPSVHGSCAYAGYLVRFVPASEVLPKYIFLFTKTQAFAGFLRVMAISSTIENVNGEKYANSPLPFPPLIEQAAIVRFIEHADQRIRRYIHAKQKLITLLEEHSRVIVNQVVTGQINVRTGRPYSSYRASGFDWLGDVPHHWEVCRCGRLFREVAETGSPDAELLSIDRFLGIVRQSETGRKERAAEDRSTYKRVRPGQLAYNLMNAFMGSIGVSAHDGILSPAYAVAEPLRNLDPFFFHHLLRTPLYTAQFDRYSYGIMYERNRLYFDRFRQIPVPVPPFAEQGQIVEFLKAASAKIVQEVEYLGKQVELARELRNCLIAEVVTGKLDVRGAAMRLPDEIEKAVSLNSDSGGAGAWDDTANSPGIVTKEA